MSIPDKGKIRKVHGMHRVYKMYFFFNFSSNGLKPLKENKSISEGSSAQLALFLYWHYPFIMEKLVKKKKTRFQLL